MTSHKQGLLDTSVIILLGEIDDLDALPEESAISTITLAELTLGPLVAANDTERAFRQAHVQQAEADFHPVPFDVMAARAFGQIASDFREAGRKKAARSFDALIAATALALGLPLYTCNPDDFEGVAGLEIVPVPHPNRTTVKP